MVLTNHGFGSTVAGSFTDTEVRNVMALVVWVPVQLEGNVGRWTGAGNHAYVGHAADDGPADALDHNN